MALRLDPCSVAESTTIFVELFNFLRLVAVLFYNGAILPSADPYLSMYKVYFK